ncbi:M28 family peptidase, partial [bacterium]|nr:M28 family peptidase [bacterium]
DSTSGDAQSEAPGAEDNASGTSLVMELARASAGREFERTVQFVLFDAEEIGLRGSQHFVDEAVSEGREIVAAITADMVSYHDRNYGVIIEGEDEWEWLMTAMADNVAGFTDIASEKTYHSWGSDHVPFQQAGIAAFLAIDMDWSEYPYYHTTSDTWDAIAATSGLGLQIARAAAGTLADVAGLTATTTPAPDTPQAAVATLSAYPNPFNPRVTVAFAVAAPTAGELAVYDLMGRKVRTLASGVFLAGEQAVTWDGVDERGRAVPSGVYMVRLRTGDEGGASRKVQLVR